MQIDTGPRTLSMRYRLERLTVSAENISARIARLAQMLGLDLSQESDILRVFRLDVPDGARAEARMQELRALLVMRYGLVRSCAQTLGRDATRLILSCAQEQLEGEGYSSKASGSDVRHMLGEN